MFLLKRIMVDKNQLERKLAEISATGRVLVELSIVPGETDGGIFRPPFLHVGCLRQDGTYEDHESIDECLVPDLFIRKSA